MYNVSQAIKAQGEYCKENKYPHFAPSSGRCFRCSNQIYEGIKHERTHNGVDTSYISGITVEQAGSELITGCPHCNWSYCD